MVISLNDLKYLRLRIMRACLLMVSGHLNYLLILIITFPLISSCNNPSKTEENQEEISTMADLSALPDSPRIPDDNPQTKEKIELGKLLFFDPILSGNKDVACATCHHPEFGYAESLEISIGVNGHGLGEKRIFKNPNNIPFTKRNSQSILNTAFNGINKEAEYDPKTAPMFWDLRVESLEKQAMEPIKALEEMRGIGHKSEDVLEVVLGRLKELPEYKRLFEEVFNMENAITSENLGKAIAAYERTLVANNSRFDLYMRGDTTALSTFEKEGLQLFLKAGCAKCHNGPMFSDFKTHVLGVQDNEKLLASDKGVNNTYAFRTPTLRNLRFTSPYMHSGKLRTLDEVLEFYEDLGGKELRNPHVKREQLDPLAKDLKLEFKDIRLIVEFLSSLNDSNFDRTIPSRVPSGLKVGGEIYDE